MAITHKYTLMCDEMRREDNGKFLLIGVYADVMLSGTFPFTLPGLTFFVKLESDRPGSWSIRMRLEHLDTGEKMLEAMGAINFQRPGAGFNPIRTPPLQFKAPGVYHFVLDVEGQADPILYEFSVGLNIPQGQGPSPGSGNNPWVGR
jgi:hypothetical protein